MVGDSVVDGEGLTNIERRGDVDIADHQVGIGRKHYLAHAGYCAVGSLINTFADVAVGIDNLMHIVLSLNTVGDCDVERFDNALARSQRHLTGNVAHTVGCIVAIGITQIETVCDHCVDIGLTAIGQGPGSCCGGAAPQGVKNSKIAGAEVGTEDGQVIAGTVIFVGLINRVIHVGLSIDGDSISITAGQRKGVCVLDILAGIKREIFIMLNKGLSIESQSTVDPSAIESTLTNILHTPHQCNGLVGDDLLQGTDPYRLEVGQRDLQRRSLAEHVVVLISVLKDIIVGIRHNVEVTRIIDAVGNSDGHRLSVTLINTETASVDVAAADAACILQVELRISREVGQVAPVAIADGSCTDVYHLIGYSIGSLGGDQIGIHRNGHHLKVGGRRHDNIDSLG